jgi:hypothetical protein
MGRFAPGIVGDNLRLYAAALSTGRIKNLGSKRGAQEVYTPRLFHKRVLLVSPGYIAKITFPCLHNRGAFC